MISSYPVRMLAPLRGPLRPYWHKDGCGEAECGACTVLWMANDHASCLSPLPARMEKKTIVKNTSTCVIEEPR